MIDLKAHWEHIYHTKAVTQVSWFQPDPALSFSLIQRTGLPQDAQIVDVGGGASLLVDKLLDAGYKALTVLDISGTALRIARERLGVRAELVTWLEADITTVDFPPSAYDLWHDRATFHFMTAADVRERYIATFHRALRPGGQAIFATFAPDGPTRCSNLDVQRYDCELLGSELGDAFGLVDSLWETHRTPSHAEQRFIY